MVHPQNSKRQRVLTNDSIVELVDAGFSEGTIIRRIEQSPVEFDLATENWKHFVNVVSATKSSSAMKAAMGEDK